MITRWLDRPRPTELRTDRGEKVEEKESETWAFSSGRRSSLTSAPRSAFSPSIEEEEKGDGGGAEIGRKQRKEGSLFWRAFYSKKGLRKIVKPNGDYGDALSPGKCEVLSPLAAELRKAD